MHKIADPKLDQIARSQLAVDGQVEECQFPDPVGELQADPNSPDLLQAQGRLLPDQLSLVPRPYLESGLSEVIHDDTPRWQDGL